MATLYRKYRPQIFAEVIGQNHIKITLQHEIERGEIGHAYLFCGPRGLGKTTLARLFAKSINCLNRKEGLPAEAGRPAQAGESEPCNQCSSCLDIIANRSIDIIEIDAASHTGVDNVRENIIENSRFTPTSSKYKVFIIDEVHMLSLSAFNALLKTLEEPPKHTIFILCTTEVHKLPQTIISRCQRFDLKKVSAKDMLERLERIIKLEGKKVENEVLKNIVLHSEGCVRDAESLLGKILTLGDDITRDQAELVLPRSDFNAIINFLNFLAEKNTTAAIELINKLVEDGVDLQIFTESLLEYLRKILLVKVNDNLSDFGVELDEESEKSAKRLAERFSYDKLLSIIELIAEKFQEMKSAVIQQLPLEVAVIQIISDVVGKKEDDFFPPTGGPGGPGDSESETKKIKEKIKEKLSQLNPKKSHQEKTVLNNFGNEEKIIDGPDDGIKIDLLAKSDKLKPNSFFQLEAVMANWQAIIDAILEKNYTLSALLKISQPLKVRGNILEIGVKSNFYKSRLDEMRNKKMIEGVMSNILKAEVAVMGIVKEDTEPLIKIESEEEVKRQIFESRRILSEKLGEPVNVFSYPEGAFTPQLRQLVIGAGYKAAVATNPGKDYPSG
ncbi:DNA polymerase III subunit gamma/tau, partial [Candidatus Falkowbacteria bacterium]|nr:DNA polymerase III subunit gamma/tau [Candidatus Falkowbacteria bacterium]